MLCSSACFLLLKLHAHVLHVDSVKEKSVLCEHVCGVNLGVDFLVDLSFPL